MRSSFASSFCPCENVAFAAIPHYPTTNRWVLPVLLISTNQPNEPKSIYNAGLACCSKKEIFLLFFSYLFSLMHKCLHGLIHVLHSY